MSRPRGGSAGHGHGTGRGRGPENGRGLADQRIDLRAAPFAPKLVASLDKSRGEGRPHVRAVGPLSQDTAKHGNGVLMLALGEVEQAQVERSADTAGC